MSEHSVADSVKDALKKLEKEMEKMAIRHIGTMELIIATTWMTQVEENEKLKLYSLTRKVHKFQDDMADVAKGKWVDSAKKYVNQQAEKLQKIL